MSRNRYFHRRVGAAAIVLAAALAVSSCGVADQVAPSIGAPSAASLSLNASLSADRIERDGVSRSTVTIQARNETGGPAAGRRILISATGPAGTALSAGEVTTLSDGRATFAVTAPPSSSLGDVITVGMTPVDGNGNPTHATQTLSIRLTPSNSTAPSASFTFSPAAPGVNEPVTFNASGSTDEGTPCGTRCTYAWDLDDGDRRTGMIVTKSYSSSGNKSVMLTVTDPAGAAGLPSVQNVPVAAPAAPVAVILFSPTAPRLGEQVNFDGGTSTVGQGATIESYTWIWGDGTEHPTSPTPRATHSYQTAGTYAVRLTIRDSLGRTNSVSTSVTVAMPAAPAAVIVFSPTAPHPQQRVNFDGGTSTVGQGATIESYTWVWGDEADNETSSSPQAGHTYALAGDYVVRLTIRDSLGRTSSTIATVPVKP